MAATLDDVVAALGRVQSSLDEHSTELKSLNKAFGKMSGDMEEVHEDIAGLRDDMLKLPASMMTIIRSELAPMGLATASISSVRKLRKEISAMEARLEALERQVRGNKD